MKGTVAEEIEAEGALVERSTNEKTVVDGAVNKKLKVN